MGVIYNGAHAITFTKLRDNTTKNSWRDLSLIPSSKPYIQPPKPQFDYTPLARSKEIIDLSMALRKTFGFESTQGQWEFYIDHEDWKWTNWTQEYWELEDFFDGTMFTVKLDDPYDDNIYTGTISMASYKPGEDFSTITLAYNINWLLDADMMPDWYGSPYPKYLEVTKLPSKKRFEDGETIDYTGIEVKLLDPKKAYYTDTTYPDSIIPFDQLIFDTTQAVWDKTGKMTVSVKWDNVYRDGTLSQNFTIKVNVSPYAKSLKATPPTKVEQYIGETIDYTGCVVTAYKADGTKIEYEEYPNAVIPLSEITFSEPLIPDPDSIMPITGSAYGIVPDARRYSRNYTGEYFVNLSWTDPNTYETLTVSLFLTCVYQYPVKLVLDTPPSTTSYIDGTEVDYTGMVVKLARHDDTIYTNETYPDGVLPNDKLWPTTIRSNGETSDRVSISTWVTFDENFGSLYPCHYTFTVANNVVVYLLDGKSGDWAQVNPTNLTDKIYLDGDFDYFPPQNQLSDQDQRYQYDDYYVKFKYNLIDYPTGGYNFIPDRMAYPNSGLNKKYYLTHFKLDISMTQYIQSDGAMHVATQSEVDTDLKVIFTYPIRYRRDSTRYDVNIYIGTLSFVPESVAMANPVTVSGEMEWDVSSLPQSERDLQAKYGYYYANEEGDYRGINIFTNKIPSCDYLELTISRIAENN